MNALEVLLNENEPGNPKPAEIKTLKWTEKPTAATLKADSLSAQDVTIASASVGGVVFRSAKDFIADIPKAVGFTLEIVSAPVASKK